MGIILVGLASPFAGSRNDWTIYITIPIAAPVKVVRETIDPIPRMIKNERRR